MDILHIVVAETMGTDGEYYAEVYPCRNDKDAIRKAIPIIKENGWFVWGETDYENKLTIWVTKTDVRPHPWYGRM